MNDEPSQQKERVRSGPHPVPPITGDPVEPPVPPAPGRPVPFPGAVTYADFVASGGEIPTPAELALAAAGPPGGPFVPLQNTYTALNIGSTVVRARARTVTPWIFLEPSDPAAPPQYDPEPDPLTGFVDRAYAPPEVAAPHPAQRLRVFYPDTARHAMPAAGWPFVFHVSGGNFLESTPFTSVTPTGQAAFYKLLERGVAVVSVGCVGIDSTGLGPAPNLFHDQGSSEWDDFGLFWGEKDATWAWLEVQFRAAAWGLDKTRGIVFGNSSGALVTSWVALGPERGGGSWAGLSAPLQESTAICAAAVAIEPPAWWNSLVHDFFGFHFEDASAPGTRAPTLGDARPSDLAAASLSRWIRQPGSSAATTPVFLAYDDVALSTDFARNGAGDPTLSDALDPAIALHPYWSGIILRQDLLFVAPLLHGPSSELWVRRGAQLPPPNALETGQIAAPLSGNTPQFLSAAVRWILKRLGRDHVDLKVPPHTGKLLTALVDMNSVILAPGTYAGTVTVEDTMSTSGGTTFPVGLQVAPAL